MSGAHRTPERRIDVGDRAFRVLSTVSAASGRRPTYVLVHGIGMSHRYYARLHERLAETADVHSVDLPGYAGLPKPAENIDIASMAAALGEALDDVFRSMVAEGPVTVVGHSMGAQWVVELGVQRPDLVSGVVVIGAVADERHRSLAAQALALALDSLGEPPAVNTIVFTDYLRAGMRWYLAQVQHMMTYPIEERVSQLATPLLVLRGGTDPIAGQEWCRRLRDRAADGVFVEVPGHNHVVQWSAPRAVASALSAFTASRAASGAR